MRRRTLAVVLAAASLISACAGPSEEDAATVVTVFGPYRDVEADRFSATMLQLFETVTGIRVRYTGSADFVVDLRSRLGEGNDPPDIAIVPQPGLVAEMLADDRLVELDGDVGDALDASYAEGTRDLGVFDQQLVGVPIRITTKSLVWYRPDVFEERGWSVPATMDDLTGLVADVVADDTLAPWCLAVDSGSATGWPATDWVEDLVARRSGAETYQGWADGDVPFSSLPIQAAFDEFSSLVLADGHLVGGPVAAAQTPIAAVFNGLLGNDPTCAMVKQADFARSWLPNDVEVGPDGDVDVFVLPATGTDGRTPPLVAGLDLAVQFNDAPEVAALMLHLAGPDTGAAWAAVGGYVSPKVSIGLDTYPEGFERELAETLLTAPDLVLDASDVMPVDVGTNLYWEKITEWMLGVVTFDDLANELDDAFAEALRDR